MMLVNQLRSGGDTDGKQALAAFRHELYASLHRRADSLFELCDALLGASGPVTSLPELTLDPVHRRGHGRCTTRWRSVRSTSPGSAGHWLGWRCRAPVGAG